MPIISRDEIQKNNLTKENNVYRFSFILSRSNVRMWSSARSQGTQDKYV